MKISEARPECDFRLFLRFDDGTAGTVDLSEFAGHGVFAAWNESGIFQQVRVTEQGAVEWPGEIDLCPDALYLRLTGKSPEDLFPSLARQSAHA
jgi:hypothetical protein